MGIHMPALVFSRACFMPSLETDASLVALVDIPKPLLRSEVKNRYILRALLKAVVMPLADIPVPVPDSFLACFHAVPPVRGMDAGIPVSPDGRFHSHEMLELSSHGHHELT